MDKISNAICYATQLFDGKYRKAEKCPAIFHSLEVAQIVQPICNDADVICAAILHDTVEDANVSISEIKERFGEKVAYLVKCETEDKLREQNPSDSWIIRKTKSLEILKEHTEIEVKVLWLGDKLSNMRSFSRLQDIEGNEMWNHFNQKNPNEQKKYYETILKELENFKDESAYKEFCFLVNKVFG